MKRSFAQDEGIHIPRDFATELMERFQKGDEEAFIKIYEEFKRPIYYFILNMTKGQVELSEEITHEAFIKLYSHRDQFNFSVKFTTWFWTIARNLTIDELRKRNPLDYVDQKNGDELDDIVPARPFEMERFLQTESQKAELQKAITQLNSRQREAILLRIASELEYEEIGVIMNLKANAVKALINRAKNALIKIINHEEAS